MGRLWLVVVDFLELSPRGERTVKRLLKGFVAGIVAQMAVWMGQGMPAVDWKFFLIAPTAALLLAIEKALQPEKPEMVEP
jgi:hypothetical protein